VITYIQHALNGKLQVPFCIAVYQGIFNKGFLISQPVDFAKQSHIFTDFRDASVDDKSINQ
jgi:hypothetical protein